MQNYKDYTDTTLRMPPKNVKVMVIFDDGGRDICFLDAWGILHGEKERLTASVFMNVWKPV